MQKILFDLYYGNIRPSENIYPQGEEYQRVVDQICAIEKTLLSQLDDVGRELYKQLVFATNTRATIENSNIFAEAFRLGSNITLSCMNDK